MAPELIEGRPASTLSDIYSLGVLLYQVVRADFSKALGTGWERTIDDPLLREDIAACVDHEPDRRLPNAEDLAIRLRQLDERRAEREVFERERRHGELIARHEELVRQRNRWLLAVLLLAGLTLGVVFLRSDDTETNALRQQLLERDAEVQELRERVKQLEQR
jgi:serine/threonine protein kinase